MVRHKLSQGQMKHTLHRCVTKSGLHLQTESLLFNDATQRPVRQLYMLFPWGPVPDYWEPCDFWRRACFKSLIQALVHASMCACNPLHRCASTRQSSRKSYLSFVKNSILNPTPWRSSRFQYFYELWFYIFCRWVPKLTGICWWRMELVWDGRPHHFRGQRYYAKHAPSHKFQDRTSPSPTSSLDSFSPPTSSQPNASICSLVVVTLQDSAH